MCSILLHKFQIVECIIDASYILENHIFDVEYIIIGGFININNNVSLHKFKIVTCIIDTS